MVHNLAQFFPNQFVQITSGNAFPVSSEFPVRKVDAIETVTRSQKLRRLHSPAFYQETVHALDTCGGQTCAQMMPVHAAFLSN